MLKLGNQPRPKSKRGFWKDGCSPVEGCGGYGAILTDAYNIFTSFRFPIAYLLQPDLLGDSSSMIKSIAGLVT